MLLCETALGDSVDGGQPRHYTSCCEVVGSLRIFGRDMLAEGTPRRIKGSRPRFSMCLPGVREVFRGEREDIRSGEDLRCPFRCTAVRGGDGLGFSAVDQQDDGKNEGTEQEHLSLSRHIFTEVHALSLFFTHTKSFITQASKPHTHQARGGDIRNQNCVSKLKRITGKPHPEGGL